MSLDPNFVTALKKAHVDGLTKKLQQRRESCDRGAKVLQQMLVDPEYQSKVIEATRSNPGFSYCESFHRFQGNEADIMNCLENTSHTECKRLSTLMFIHSDPFDTKLCFNSSKFSP